jgi:hypothetical protein
VARRAAVLTAVAVPALAAWCGWASGFHRRTTPALVTWLVSLAAVVLVVVLLRQGRHGRRPGLHVDPVAEPWPRPTAAGRHPALLGTAPWLALALVALAWDVLGIDSGPHQAHLTISALTQAYRPLNAAMLLVWILVGVGYGFARARAPVTPALPGAVPRAGGTVPCAAVAGLLATTAPPALLLPSDPTVGVVFWVALVPAAVACDLAARRSHGRFADAEELVRFVSAPLVANLLLVIAWGFAGYHLFAF